MLGDGNHYYYYGFTMVVSMDFCALTSGLRVLIFIIMTVGLRLSSDGSVMDTCVEANSMRPTT